MIEAVFVFAAITAVGELVLLHSMPKFRNWVLRTESRMTMLHVVFMCLNLWIHWGTMTGTMTGVTAFLVSFVVCHFARILYNVRSA